MTNLTERLEKHLQSIKEANGEISNREILKLLKNPTPTLKRALNTKDRGGAYLYSVYLIDNFKDHPDDGFVDSYVEPEPNNFMKYCICKALGVESGIDINKAIKDVERNVDTSEKMYRGELKEYSAKAYLDRGEDIDDEAKDLIKRGIKPEKILITADDVGDETVNPSVFATEAPEFAKACGATELANKLKSNAKVKRAEELLDHIIQL